MAGEEFKLNRRRLAADYKSGKLGALDPRKTESAGEEDELMLHLRQVVSVTLEKDMSEISPMSDFFTDLGGTSLDYFAMIAKLQEDFGLPFPQSDGKSLSTVKELYEYIRNSENNAD